MEDLKTKGIKGEKLDLEGRESGRDVGSGFWGNGCGRRRRAATLSSLCRNLTPSVHKNALVIAFAPFVFGFFFCTNLLSPAS